MSALSSGFLTSSSLKQKLTSIPASYHNNKPVVGFFTPSPTASRDHTCQLFNVVETTKISFLSHSNVLGMLLSDAKNYSVLECNGVLCGVFYFYTRVFNGGQNYAMSLQRVNYPQVHKYG